MNIVLVVLDTLRYDYVGANGNDRIRTPHLDALAAKSWVFDRAYAGSFPTIPHRTDVLRGSCGKPFHIWAPLKHDTETFPPALVEAGYATQLIHDTPHLTNGGNNFDWPFQAWTMIRGGEVDRPWIDDKPLTMLPNWKTDPLFDYVCEPECRTKRGHILVSYTRANRRRQADEDWNAARTFLTAADFVCDNAERERYFLWIDSFDPHEPWEAPPELVASYDDTSGYDGTIDPRSLINPHELPDDPDHRAAAIKRYEAMYAANVTWVDRWFGELMRAIEEAGQTDRTAVLVTSDHGTSIGTHDRVGKGVPVYEQEAHVPLMVHAPSRGAGRCDAFVQPQDITATILALAGARMTEGVKGTDLLATAERDDRPRKLALCGTGPSGWAEGGTFGHPFTVFADEGYLVMGASPDDSELYDYAGVEPVDSPDAELVERLWRAGLDELADRGAPDELVAWIASGGRGNFPSGACPSPRPPGYHNYWGNSLGDW